VIGPGGGSGEAQSGRPRVWKRSWEPRLDGERDRRTRAGPVEEGERWGVLIDDVKSGGSAAQGAMPKADTA